MKKKQLSKLALMGLTAGVALTSTALSAANITETNGTYLAGGCGAGTCGGGKNRTNTNNYTADTTAPASSNLPVNPNMSPRGEAMQGSCGNITPAQGQANTYNQATPNQANTYNQATPNQATGSCGGQSANNQGFNQGTGSCGGQSSNQGFSSSCASNRR